MLAVLFFVVFWLCVCAFGGWIWNRNGRHQSQNESIKLDLLYADRCKHVWESNNGLELETIMLSVKKYIVVTSEN